MMEKLTTFKPIIGDDNPITTLALRDVVEGFGFSALSFPTDKPLTYAIKDKLVDFATRYYRNHEIIGTTLRDFQDNLQLDLDANIDTFEKMLAVYDDDIAKPTQSREIRRTYDLLDTTDDQEDITTTSTTDNSSESTDFDIPADNDTAQGVSKVTGTGNTSGNTKSNRGLTGSAKKTGTETEYWSDVGVAPNYILLNGFLDNNRTLYQVFVSFFANDFQVIEVYYG